MDRIDRNHCLMINISHFASFFCIINNEFCNIIMINHYIYKVSFTYYLLVLIMKWISC